MKLLAHILEMFLASCIGSLIAWAVWRPVYKYFNL